MGVPTVRALETQLSRQYVHRIDAPGRIVSVNRDWLQFAAENRWPRTTEQLRDTPLDHYICGLEVRHVYNMFVASARARHGWITFKYRCDSFACRRLLQMTIRHETETDTVEFRGRDLTVAAKVCAMVVR